MKPTGGADRALFWTFVVAAFAVAAAGLAARAVDRMALGYESERANYAIVQVEAPEGEPGMMAAVGVLHHTRHVLEVSPITAERAAQVLSRVSGAPVDPSEMPPVNLIEIELDAPAHGEVGGDVEAALAEGGVTAHVVSAPGGAAPATALMMRNIALWVAGLFAALMALLVSLTARGFAARRADYVTVLADIGATAPQAGARVGDEAAALGLRAGLIGAVAAAAIAAALVLSLVPGMTANTLAHVVTPLDAAPLVIAPLLAAVAAGMGARAGAESVHAQAARLA